MKVDFKKLTATTVSVAVLASLSGCALFDKDDEAVLKAADDFATAIVKVKTGDIYELIADPSFEESELETLVDTDAYGDDYAAICSAIAGTLSYEIDEESVESSKKNGNGKVDITFSIVDYAAAYDDVTADGGDLDAFLDALSDGDTQEIDVTVEFVKDGDNWLVDDEDGEIFDDVYAFYLDALDYSFGPAISTDLIDEIEWYYSDNGVYTDPYQIELDIIPTAEGQEIEWQFTYEYYLDGQLIYTSDECTDSGYWIESYYGPNYDSAAQLTNDSTLVPGDYRCIVYDLNGNVLADSTCSVVEGSTSTVVDVPVAGGDMAEIWADGIDDYWYSYSDGTGYAIESGEYGTDETTMEYTCQVNDEANLAYFPVYYEVYYSATGNADDAEFVYSATITPSEYSNGYFYEFQYTQNGGLDAGTYYILGATDENGTEMLFNVTAEVS